MKSLRLKGNIGKGKNIDWGIVTEKDIPAEMADNIFWLHKSYYVGDIRDVSFIKLLLKSLMNTSSNTP